ncbi:hypothetical protein [Bacillus sp. 165]|uniref:hypothetical protein n=1 Tax=Bacillus sp. 165 TaxID=1529117 RepID=UPI001ADA5054|nr:hypothetical protein [Bacillus sp. 165]MBO9128551.1 hypothetical protein [Bacillus sp. 165]
MKNKVIWLLFWTIIVGAVSWCAYTVTPYVFGDKPIQATEPSSTSKKPGMDEQEVSLIEYGSTTGFIETYHHMLNELTGWGRINNPDWDEVHSTAQQVMEKLDAIQYKGDSDLQQDFQDIYKLAKELETANGGFFPKNNLRKLHRYFHDLDAVMNYNRGDGNYYKITKWGEANRNN